MPSISWKLTCLLILCFWTLKNVHTREIRGYEEKEIFHSKEIVFDHQPLKDNRLVYAACVFNRHRTNMTCTVYLWTVFIGNTEPNKTCVVNYQVDESRTINRSQYQLKLLFDERVLFMWSDREANEDLIFSSQNLVCRTIDMSTCRVRETRIGFQRSKHVHTRTDDFYVVPYADTFDIFFRNANICGDTMCGQTHDKDGKLINGPVASYLPVRFVRRDSVVHPVKPRSPLLGHFLLSSSQVMKLVSSRYGEIKDLMEYPAGVNSFAYSCDNGYLGFCWLSGYARRQINCTQFDTQGTKSLASIIELEYNAGKWMAMQNLADGGFLLLTSQCDDDNWCDTNVDRVAFFVLKVNRDGSAEEIHRFLGVDCNYAQDFKADIGLKPNGEICVTLACHVGGGDGESRVVLKAKSIKP